ncbi:hypothetical protein HID58_094768, partial [Brassica napus]
PLEACPSLSYSLSKKNLSRRKLSTWVLWWRLKHGERRCFWHGGFKEKGQAKKEMLVLKPTAQICPFMMRVALEVQGTSTAEVEGRRRSLNKACEVLGELAEVSPQWNDDVVEVQASSPKEMEVLSTRLIMELSCAHQQA